MTDYKRLTKPIARKMYNCGYEIKLLPCKVNSAIALDYSSQGHFWINPFAIKKDSPVHIVQFEDKSLLPCDTFDRTVCAYEYYNCCSELGYYSHYFVTQQDYDEWCMNYQFNKEDTKNGETN